jgi:hypothetical protein
MAFTAVCWWLPKVETKHWLVWEKIEDSEWSLYGSCGQEECPQT